MCFFITQRNNPESSALHAFDILSSPKLPFGIQPLFNANIYDLTVVAVVGFSSFCGCCDRGWCCCGSVRIEETSVIREIVSYNDDDDDDDTERKSEWQRRKNVNGDGQS
jgi:hypothetical protein